MRIKKTVLLTSCLLVALGLLLPLAAYAQDAEPKVVRVGWFESTYCYRDQFGERRGISYACRLDQIYKGEALDALVCDVNQFHTVNKQYGKQFSDDLLHRIGSSVRKLAQKTGGIGGRLEEDTFLVYCPHLDSYDRLLKEFLSEVFPRKAGEETVKLRFGVYSDAQLEPDIEERFIRAKAAADSAAHDPQTVCAVYGAVQ